MATSDVLAITFQRNQSVPGPMSPRFNSPAAAGNQGGQLGNLIKGAVNNAQQQQQQQQQHMMFTPRSQAPLQWNQHMMAGGGVVQVQLPSSTPTTLKSRQSNESPMKKVGIRITLDDTTVVLDQFFFSSSCWIIV